MFEAELGEAAFGRYEQHLEDNPVLLGRAYALVDSEQAVPVTVLFFRGVGRQMVTGVGGDEKTERLVLMNVRKHLGDLPTWTNVGCRVRLNAQHLPVDSSNGHVLDMLVAVGDGTTVTTGEGLVLAALAALDLAVFPEPAGEQHPLPVVMGSLYGFEDVDPRLLTLRERMTGVGRGEKFVDEILPLLHELAHDGDDEREVVVIAPPETAKLLGRSRRQRFKLQEVRRVRDILFAVGIEANPFAPDQPLIAPHPLPLPCDFSGPNVGCFFDAGKVRRHRLLLLSLSVCLSGQVRRRQGQVDNVHV